MFQTSNTCLNSSQTSTTTTTNKNKILLGSNQSILNGSNLKYICEICGLLLQNIDSLKLHLNIHHQNNQFKSIISNNNTTTTNNKKTTPSININIPQSMTIFNLKDISSKLKQQEQTSSQITQQTTTTTTTIQLKPIDIQKQNSLKLNNNKQETIIKLENLNEDLKTVFQLEEPLIHCDLNNNNNNNNCLNLDQSSTNQSRQLIPLNNFTLPYHYSEYENIYICNLCNCTYDSLRSIKAHLWKHSGHHELSYPIHDHSNRIAETTGKPIMTLSSKLETNRKTIRSLQIPINLNLSSQSNLITQTVFNNQLINKKNDELNKIDSNNDNNLTEPINSISSGNGNGVGGGGGGGICSALLEVIEKLRNDETITNELNNINNQATSPNNNNSKMLKTRRKRKIKLINNNQLNLNNDENNNCIKIKKSKKEPNLVKEVKLRKKRKTTQKVNQLIQIHDQLKSQQQQQQQLINQTQIISNNNNVIQNLNNYEFNTIETSVVNSLYEDQDALLTKFESQTESEPLNFKNKIRYSCQLCYSLFNDKQSLNEHKNNCKNNLENDLTNDNNNNSDNENEFEYVCDLCLDDEKKFSKHKSLIDHFKLDHSITKINSDKSSSSSIVIKSYDTEILKLIELLANNDDNEQYVCNLCSYICYHLPSLKSHMWTHVKNEKFDYSVNTAIINAALDYENKLNRNLSSINHRIRFRDNMSISSDYEHSNENKEDDLNNYSAYNSSSSSSSSSSSACSSSNEHEDQFGSNSNRIVTSLDKKLYSTLNMINLKDMEKKLIDLNSTKLNDNLNDSDKLNRPMVSFRCSKCGFETIDLCLLRLHKRNHFIKT